MRRPVMAATLCVVLALGPAACGDDGDDPQRASAAPASATKGVFVGKVSGTRSYIALISDGERVTGYLCDSGDNSTWFANAKLSGGTARLTTRDGARLGDATLGAATAGGRVRIAGRARRFTAGLTRGGAGAYRAVAGERGEPGSVEIGWVLLPDGTQRGNANFIDQNGDLVVDPAPAIDPSAGRVRIRGIGSVAKEKLGPGFIDENGDL